MAKTIHYEKPFTMEMKEVRSLVEENAQGMATKYGLEIKWDGDTLALKGKGVEGKFDIQAQKVVVDMKLSLPASLFADKIEAKLKTGMEQKLK